MPAHLNLERLSYATPDGVSLFDNLNLAFGAERTGLVGRNGVGKTTLLRLMLGELTPTAGTVAARGQIGVLRQAMSPPPGATVADLLGVRADIDRQVRIEASRGSEEDFANALWDLDARIAQALAAVGMVGQHVDREAATLSGGEATRLALAALLIAQPDLILLDEPTNNLDAEARGMVAGVLRGWKGGAVVVSHDRALLRQMDRIVELSSLGAKVYGGGYDLYLARKGEEEAAAAQGLASAERAVAQAAREAQGAREKKARRDAAGRRFADKGGTPKILLGAMAERAENSSARENRLAQKLAQQAADDLALAQGKVERLRRLAFDLPPSGLAAGKAVLTFEDVTFAHPGGRELALSLRITGPERVAVTGPNGAGKTTLIGLATGDLTPARGRVTLGVAAAVLDQRAAMLEPGETLAAAFRRLNPTASDNAARAALARFLFRNVTADKTVATLSGGERLRAALACLLCADAPPQLLILDEPTNHLDLDSIAAIEAALAGYDGALLVVSHDRDFLEAIGVEREVAL